MYKVPSGPTVFFDCDDTLVMWSPSDVEVSLANADMKKVTFVCNGFEEEAYPNDYNVNLLIKLRKRGHNIVVWSSAGSDWAEAVVKGLSIESYVDVVCNKPMMYVDDKPDPRDWMGKHQYITFTGNVADPHPRQTGVE